MKRIVASLILTFATTQAFAEDKYQLIPVVSVPYGNIQVSGAVVVQLSNGQIIAACHGNIKATAPVGQFGMDCRKASVVQGTIPPGPAIASPYQVAPNLSVVSPVIWKINQVSGDVTFCAASEWTYEPDSFSDWHCATARLPQ
jgi:hypothetical protein